MGVQFTSRRLAQGEDIISRRTGRIYHIATLYGDTTVTSTDLLIVTDSRARAMDLIESLDSQIFVSR